MSERKLVEAFRTFFEKSVAPNVSRNDEVMREWNHLNKIISADPIDYSQIEFYLLLANKSSGASSQPPTSRGSQQNIGSSNKLSESDNKFRYSDFNVIMEKNNLDKNNFEKKGSFMGSSGSKKKNLINSLEGFQKMLVYNQDRLENLSKKETGSSAPQAGLNTSANGPSMRRY